MQQVQSVRRQQPQVIITLLTVTSVARRIKIKTSAFGLGYRVSDFYAVLLVSLLNPVC